MLTSILFLVGRVALGVYFVNAGINHFTKTDMLAGYAQVRGLSGGRGLTLLSGVVLILGGLGVLLGVLVSWAIAVLVVFLLVVSFSIHHFWTDTDPQQKMVEMHNFMKNLAIAAGLLMALAVPTPWIWALF